MACIEIVVENKTAPHLDIEATHICSVDTEGSEVLFASDGALYTTDGKKIYIKTRHS